MSGPAGGASSVSSGGRQAGEFEAERTQALARARIIGLRIGLSLLHAVEKQPALAGHIVAGGKMEYRLPALLHRRCWPSEATFTIRAGALVFNKGSSR